MLASPKPRNGVICKEKYKGLLFLFYLNDYSEVL